MSVCLSVCKKDNSAKVVEVFGSHFMTERSGVARILCQGAQVWRREKTENMSYHPRQHCILLSMRYCIRPVCHSHTIIKLRYTIV